MAKTYDLDSTDLSQYNDLTKNEREAWLHPSPNSYHSFHVERMGTDVYRWRNSHTSTFTIGSTYDLQIALLTMQMRKLDPEWRTYNETLTNNTLLTVDEINDLLGDL